MKRALKLDQSLFKEVEEDESANSQALVVLLITALCTTIGIYLTGLTKEEGGMYILLLGLAVSVIGWMLLLFIIYILGSTLFGTKRTDVVFLSLFRTVTFAASPGVLRFFIFLPALGLLLDIAAQLWCITGMIIALRSIFDFSTGRATALCIAGWIIYSVLIFGFLKLLGVNIVLPPNN
ncbi:MAG: hypothetical protein D6734_10775 [Candidatus Schekmanbacteria bacterium]|nr:MAG: hypothetical protein D6734_10775 [Candidatus Schekmanbacteria bacterium]